MGGKWALRSITTPGDITAKPLHNSVIGTHTHTNITKRTYYRVLEVKPTNKPARATWTNNNIIKFCHRINWELYNFQLRAIFLFFFCCSKREYIFLFFLLLVVIDYPLERTKKKKGEGLMSFLRWWGKLVLMQHTQGFIIHSFLFPLSLYFSLSSRFKSPP